MVFKYNSILGRPIFRGYFSGKISTSYCSSTLYVPLVGFRRSNQTSSYKSCEREMPRTMDLRFERSTESMRSIMVSK